MNAFMNELSIVMRLLRAEAERGLSDFDLGFSEQMVLMVLSSGKPANQDSIARTLDIDKGAIARTIAKLESKQLVTRKENPSNRREKLVALTPAAQEVLKAMSSNLSDVYERAFDGFTPEEQENVTASLSRISQNLTNRPD